MVRTLVRHVRRLLSASILFDPPGLSGDDLGAIIELRRRAEDLKRRDSSGTPSESWDAHQRQLLECIQDLDCRFFLRWPVIQETMFPVLPPYVFAELMTLWKSGRWGDHWREVVEEDAWGAPVRLPFLLRTSANRIHHAYHLCRFEDESGLSVRNFGLVVEFGGGYGSMCRVVRKCGFRGRYVIFDLPLPSAIQVFYISRLLGGHCAPGLSGWENGDGTFCESNLAALAGKLDGDDPGFGKRLFMATWSLSEAPTAVRQEILPVMRACDAYLFAYQDKFDDVDNCAYFDGLRTELGDVKWHREEISHLRGHYYLFGARRGMAE